MHSLVNVVGNILVQNLGLMVLGFLCRISRERETPPRFAQPGSFEYEYSQRWKSLDEMEKQQRDQVEKNMKDAKDKLESEMEDAYHEHQANLLRQGEWHRFFSLVPFRLLSSPILPACTSASIFPFFSCQCATISYCLMSLHRTFSDYLNLIANLMLFFSDDNF